MVSILSFQTDSHILHFFFRHEDSPVKRGPGRPRKRKNCSNTKSSTNNEPDVSAANSPAADQMETEALSPEAIPGDDVDEEGMDEETKGETEPAGICEDSGQEEETKLVVEEESPQVCFSASNVAAVKYLGA